jgi:N-acetylmuramoyl-L-alanine amidase
VKKVIVIIFLGCVALLMSFGIKERASYKIKTVVIDAGHGGHDHGCKGAGSKEKDIALKIALKLGKLIEQNYPDVKVIYTRKTDEFVELHERAEIANRNHADLFICVHINAGSKVAQGTETYVMGLHKSEDNLAVSKRENESILLEKDYKTQYEGYDPNSPESNIIFSLFQNTYREKSLIFASKVQYQLSEQAKRFDRGVKEAGFIVLWKTTMPSVLIECGFLSNPKEEKYLITDKAHESLSKSIFDAFKEYKIDMEEGDLANGKSKTAISTYENKTADEKIEERNIEVKPKPETNIIVATKSDDIIKKTNDPVKPKPQPVIEKKDTAVKTVVDKNMNDPKDKTVTQTKLDKDTSTLIVSKVEPKVSPKQEIKPEVKTNIEQKENPEKKVKPSAKKADEKKNGIKIPPPTTPTDFVVDSLVTDMNLFYTVQIGAKAEPTVEELQSFMSVPGVKVIKVDAGMKRYVVGHFKSVAESQEILKQMHDIGFVDAFVTPYAKGKRITISEAKLVK